MTTDGQHNSPLHGVSLERIVTHLLERHGWEGMWMRVPLRCFQMNQSVKSTLTFLRKHPWAKQEIEAWYVADVLRFPLEK
ncbi:MAG: VF530 family DNA-binding protein [Pseudomonadota bacterium]|nr:VF530 family DNA-binding protein [Pseudomonadota bacterium]